MKNILSILQMTKDQYEDYRFKIYWNWCQDFIIADNDFPKELQKLLANAVINHYFNVEWQKQEDYFLQIVSNYEHISKEDAKKTLGKCLLELFNRHPKELVKRAKEKEKGLVPQHGQLCNN